MGHRLVNLKGVYSVGILSRVVYTTMGGAHKDNYWKKYYKANKSKMIAYQQEYGEEYRHNNKDKIQERQSKPFKCDY